MNGHGEDRPAPGRLEVDLLEAHPETALAYEVARQLRDLLPLESMRQLRDRLPDGSLTIRGRPIPLDGLDSIVPADVFPVEDEHDLAVKLVAAVRIGLTMLDGQLASGGALQNVDAESVVRAATRRPAAIPVGDFTGPSMFGQRRRES